MTETTNEITTKIWRLFQSELYLCWNTTGNVYCMFKHKYENRTVKRPMKTKRITWTHKAPAHFKDVHSSHLLETTWFNHMLLCPFCFWTFSKSRSENIVQAKERPTTFSKTLPPTPIPCSSKVEYLTPHQRDRESGCVQRTSVRCDGPVLFTRYSEHS